MQTGFLAQKRPNLAQYWHFWPYIGIFDPFGPMPERKKNQCEQSAWAVFPTFASSRKNYDFWPKTAKFGPKYAFFGTYRPTHLVPTCLVGWLVVEPCGLYVARHLFTFI